MFPFDDVIMSVADLVNGLIQRNILILHAIFLHNLSHYIPWKVIIEMDSQIFNWIHLFNRNTWDSIVLQISTKNLSFDIESN